MLIEVVLTMGLVSVILGTASSAQNVGGLSAIAVGGYIALAGLWSSPISGASMNPVRSFAPDLVRGDLSHTWLYVVGPPAGRTRRRRLCLCAARQGCRQRRHDRGPGRSAEDAH